MGQHYILADWAGAAVRAMSRPGEWMTVKVVDRKDTARQEAAKANAGQHPIEEVNPNHLQFRSRPTDDGRHTVEVRYVVSVQLPEHIPVTVDMVGRTGVQWHRMAATQVSRLTVTPGVVRSRHWKPSPRVVIIEWPGGGRNQLLVPREVAQYLRLALGPALD